VQQLKSNFDVGRVVANENMHFNGSFISVSADGYKLDIAEPLSRIQPIALDDIRPTSPLIRASAAEIKSIRSIAGSLNFIGQAACPPATFVASAIQQRLGTKITVATALKANEILKELRRIPSLLLFPFAKTVTPLRIIGMSDASFTPTSRYGQSGIILWLAGSTTDASSQACSSVSPAYFLDWSSCKQRRIANSSLDVEILAASQADDMIVGLSRAFRTSFHDQPLTNQLLLESRSLFHLVSMFKHYGTDPRLAAVVDRLRDSFFARDLDEIGWIPGVSQLADSLTKRNPTGWRALMSAAGRSVLDLPKIAQFRGSTWRNAYTGKSR
jgi:hypothetical protein